MMFSGAASFGALVAGAVAARIGLARAVLAAGACVLAGAATFSTRVAARRVLVHDRVEPSPPLAAQDAEAS
jgi:hypothetical protein